MTLEHTPLTIGALAAAALVASDTVPVAAAETGAAVPTPQQSLLGSFTFDTAPSGGAFTDRSASASVQGAAALVVGQEGQGQAVRLSPSFWLDVKAADGTSPTEGGGSRCQPPIRAR
ncbi:MULTISPECIES: hypothetical protein [unclassified Microbacterium]|uniref:hypothetical protein n=1 Tax=unclassified Microbacterium TaxID=2609290 RepID=UPI00177CEDE3|nr:MULTISPECIES: hypothetical protein [unclassified Microbacterium]MBD8207858.1 hypothetical protein [Microbacterium sp. CFBP 8801]MBD8477171.1 hypothetical protein [Microbacterium sp. CFBP 8794]MBD8511063.1 hypothetical protein [Microbacterium sp. CFBP 8790]